MKKIVKLIMGFIFLAGTSVAGYCFTASTVVRHIYFGDKCQGKGRTANCSGWKIIVVNGGVLSIPYYPLSNAMKIEYKYTTEKKNCYGSICIHEIDDFENNKICITDSQGNPYSIGSNVEDGCYGFKGSSYLNHDYSTGPSVTLNFIADGDIQINGDT